MKRYIFVLAIAFIISLVLSIIEPAAGTVFCFIMMLAAYIVFCVLSKKIKALNDDMYQQLIILATFGVILFKAVTAATSCGFATDFACFKAWANYAYTGGLSNFYNGDFFADYPPGYIYVLYVIGMIRNLFSIPYSSGLYNFLVKLPSLICEVGLAYFIYRLALARAGRRAAFFCYLAVLVNFAIYIDGTLWSQVDAFHAFFLLLTFFLLDRKKFVIAAIVFGYCIIVKPQSLLLGPIFALPYLKVIFNKQSWLKGVGVTIASLLLALAVIFALSLPFKGTQGYLWIVGRVFDTIGESVKASYNSFGFMSMLGANMASYKGKFLFFTYQTWGYVFLFAAIAFGVFLYFWKKKDIYTVAAVTLALETAFGHSMRERYILPAIVLLLAAWAYSQNWDLYRSATLFTITASINMAVVLYYYAQEVLVAIAKPIMVSFSAITVLICIYMVYTVLKERHINGYESGGQAQAG